METVWRVILFMELKLAWRLSGVFMEKTWQIKLQENLHSNLY